MLLPARHVQVVLRQAPTTIQAADSFSAAAIEAAPPQVTETAGVPTANGVAGVKGGLRAEEVEAAGRGAARAAGNVVAARHVYRVAAAAPVLQQKKKTPQQPPLRIVSGDATALLRSNVWTYRDVVQVCVVV